MILLLLVLLSKERKLVEQLGGVVVKILSIIEVLSYNARNNVLKGYDIYSIIQYEGKLIFI